MSLGFEPGDFINISHFVINVGYVPTKPFLDQYVRFYWILPFLPSYHVAEEGYMRTVSLKFSQFSVEDSTFCFVIAPSNHLKYYMNI